MKTVAVAAAALTFAIAPAAQGATWKQVTVSGGTNIDQVSQVRTPDGVLHVVWHKGGDLVHTTIAADGKVGASVPVQSGWSSVLDPAIVAVPGGLRVFWGGIRTTDSTEPNVDLNTAFSVDGGASWQLTPGSIIPVGAQSYGSDISATTLPNGTPLQVWAGTLGTWVHSGLSAAAPNVNYQASLGNYGNFPGIAAAANGSAMMAWFSSAEAHRGVLAQGVNADGSPAGPLATMPGSQVMVGGGTVSRTQIGARAKSGGFYVAYGLGYPVANQARVWRVGASSSTLLDKTEANTYMTVAPDSKGRVWAVWTDGAFGSPRVLAARSNKDATVFGQPVDLGAVTDANQAQSVDANASATFLDVLTAFGIGTTSGGATYTTRTFPGLTLKASKGTFTVTDAGDPVKGAKVKIAGRSGKTNAKGRVTLGVRKGTATASASGYEDAKLKLK